MIATRRVFRPHCPAAYPHGVAQRFHHLWLPRALPAPYGIGYELAVLI
jgi:hypothetical protein